MDLRSHVASFSAFEGVQQFNTLILENIGGESKIGQLDLYVTLFFNQQDVI